MMVLWMNGETCTGASDNALRVSVINQTKWWFAKRFLHLDIVAEYKYIFLWDEDRGVEHFHQGWHWTLVNLKCIIKLLHGDRKAMFIEGCTSSMVAVDAMRTVPLLHVLGG